LIFLGGERPALNQRRAFYFASRAGAVNKHAMTVSPLGDSAVVIMVGDLVDPAVTTQVQAIAAEIARHPLPGVVDVVPAFASIAVFFDPPQANTFESMRTDLEMLAARADSAVVSIDPRTVDIPVSYGGERGPDLDDVAAYAQLTADEVVALHAGADYFVHAIGFAPGFPYLGGLPSKLAMPRRATPRPHVPAGSVGIGGTQTGVYPLETPGGWNLIGRTPLVLFDANRREPSLLRAGDRVKFRAVSVEEFQALSQTQPEIAAAKPEPSKHDLHAGAQRGGGSEGALVETVHDAVPGIEVVRAGMFTTVQDLGRRGHRARGVPFSGAADAIALRLANSLVGNPEDAAALEFTLVGPELRFLHDTVIALGGGEFGDLPRWLPMAVSGGTTLRIGPARTGCRGYLAVAGGIDVATVLGSRSTYVRGGFGGFHGRVLRDHDVLPVPAIRRHFRDHWRIDERIVPAYSSAPIVRVISGAQADQFGDAWMERNFKVSSQSDRMGVRLLGPALERNATHDLVSSPVAPGTIQVPPDGQPIILLADAQTIGGYPQVAHVISVDLPLVAQLRPGDAVRFYKVTLAEARELLLAQDRAVALLREGLAQKLA
jgi:KipI family sensor histidine kinase inhibitor